MTSFAKKQKSKLLIGASDIICCKIHTLMQQSDWCEIHTLMQQSDWCEIHTTLHATREFIFFYRKKKIENCVVGHPTISLISSFFMSPGLMNEYFDM